MHEKSWLPRYDGLRLAKECVRSGSGLYFCGSVDYLLLAFRFVYLLVMTFMMGFDLLDFMYFLYVLWS